ncbi:Outer membrane protein P6 [invertebrate metagenome]|uniref:Outer membrane protein P6 n=1 Tax=invertebrate metagenome TaxID=1711999 RepID=A0A2H9TB47_9ZZZZ
MQFTKLVRVGALAATALWLAGCASTGTDTAKVSDAADKSTDKVIVESRSVVDPAVQAIMDSGVIQQASAHQIQAMLDQDTYHFGFDSSRLSDKDYKALDVQAAYLNSATATGQKIIIEGHTDNRGTRTYNLALGERRANAVKNYLVAKGVSANRIDVISYGYEKPLDSANNTAAWEANRRAVIDIQ